MRTEVITANAVKPKILSFCCSKMKSAHKNGNIRYDETGHFWLADRRSIGRKEVTHCPFCGTEIYYRED